jgi:phage gpG-like protein
MAGVTVDVRGIPEVRAMLTKFPDETFQAAVVAMRVATVNAKRTIQGRFVSYSGTRGGSRLQNRSGDLRKSIKRETSGKDLANLFSRVFSDNENAAIHEFGGTINARSKYSRMPGGPYLNIPTSSNLSGAGSTMFSPGEIFATGGYIFKSKSGNFIVASKGGTPMFVLVKSVTIKPRLGMEKAVVDEIPTLLRVLSDELLRDL